MPGETTKLAVYYLSGTSRNIYPVSRTRKGIHWSLHPEKFWILSEFLFLVRKKIYVVAVATTVVAVSLKVCMILFVIFNYYLLYSRRKSHWVHDAKSNRNRLKLMLFIFRNTLIIVSGARSRYFWITVNSFWDAVDFPIQMYSKNS